MRVGVVIPSFDQFANASAFGRLVKAVEELGYDSAWLGDHIVMPQNAPAYLGTRWHEAMTYAIHGLALTSRLSFGTDILVAPYRDPLLLAKMSATASDLSNGRFQLGLGIGWLKGEFEALGSPAFADRADVTDEYLRVMRHLFISDGALSFKGRWINFQDVFFEPKAALPPPLLVGGNHPNAIRRAALLGDGWHPLFMSEQGYAAGKAEILRLRAEAGNKDPFIFSYSCPQTRVLAAEAAAIQTVVATVSETQGTSYAPDSPRDSTGRLRFIGTVAQLREDFHAFSRAGVDQIVLRFAVPNDPDIGIEAHLDQLRLFAAEVLPQLKDPAAAF